MERDTTGILMWSELFLVTTPAGREVAVALVDTQVLLAATCSASFWRCELPAL